MAGEERHSRVHALDFVRGLAIVFMVFYNWSVALQYFGLLDIGRNVFYSLFLPVMIASVFIFVSGIASRLSYERNKETFHSRYFRRGSILLAFSLLITFFTYLFVPQRTIIFGILHFFAAGSFLLPLFARLGKSLPPFSIAALILGIYLQTQGFDFNYLLWLGLAPRNFSTFDYFPLLPWLGVLLLGFHAGPAASGLAGKYRLSGVVSKLLILLGRHSLLIYLLHQPLLIAALLLSGMPVFNLP